MPKRKPAGPSLPKVIYAKMETDANDSNEHYLNADESIDSMDDGDVVGIYQLVEIKTKHVSHDLK